MVKQFADRISVNDLCQYLSLAPSVYYHHPGEGKQGAKASTYTMMKDGTKVSNEMVVADIRSCLMREFCC